MLAERKEDWNQHFQKRDKEPDPAPAKDASKPEEKASIESAKAPAKDALKASIERLDAIAKDQTPILHLRSMDP